LRAKVESSGDLVLEGHDLGELPQQIWGDSDYEYSRTIRANDVPAVLLHLVAERFQSDTAFKAWLDGKGIASTFNYWI